MSAHCCTGRGLSRPLSRPLSGAAASVLPGLALALLPKCPLCLAAWLTMATGIGVSRAAAAGMRELILVIWIAGVALAAAECFRRRGVRRSAPPPAA